MQTKDEGTSGLRNLGPASRSWLAAIGVHDRDTLAGAGANNVWLVLRRQGYPVTANLLYALHAALLDCDWRRLPPALREELRAFARTHR